MAQPTWLPKPVTEFVQSCERGQTLWGRMIWENAELQARLLRLTTREEMNSVWRQLAEADLNPNISSDPDVRAAVLRGYLLAAVYPGQSPSFWGNYPTVAQQRERLCRIAQHANDLLEALDAHNLRTVFERYTAWDTLTQGLLWIEQGPALAPDPNRDAWDLRARSLREHLGELRAATRDLHWSAPEGAPPLQVLGAKNLFAPLPQMLHALAELAALVEKMPLAKSPKQTKTVYRTAHLRHLAEYVRTWFSQPFNQVVATTMNVALDLKNKEKITERLARRLTSVS